MEGLLVLLGLVVLAFPAAVIYLLISHSGVQREMRELRAEVVALRDRLASFSEAAPERPSPNVASPPSPEVTPKPAAVASPPDEALSGLWTRRSSDAPTAPDAEPPQSAAIEAADTQDTTPPRAVVMRRDMLQRFGAWLVGNWFYAVSAVSLALAGIFLVQYGVENGLLPPPVRVLVALGFGALLIVAGEFIRRRFGDDEAATTANLPSVFSGAGIVALFGGILSARLLYDLIGAETALAGMGIVALVALVLGWFHGPLLAAVGIIGAFAGPFVVGGSSDDPSWLYGYFAILAALGLGIDTVRRWAWITVLTLVLAYPAGSLVFIGDVSTVGGYALYLTVLLILSVLMPVRRVFPDHSGTMVAETLAKTRDMPWPEFPARVAFASVLLSALGLVWVSGDGSGAFWLATALLTGLSLTLIAWSYRATALQDMALLPAVGLLGALSWQGGERMIVWHGFSLSYADNPEASFPLQVTILMGMAAALSAMALGRALALRGSDARFGLVWAGAAALIAPVAAICLELTWQPADVFGAYPWALHAAAIAALMVVFAERLARVDGPEDRLRTSLPVLSALSALAFAFTILFAETALTVAFIATTVAAAALDRAFRMPPMTVFISIGVATIGYRLIADPGLGFAFDGPLSEVLLVYGGALAGFVAALFLLAGLERPASRTLLDSAAWSTAGLLLSILLFRWLESLAGGQSDTHWAMGLFATIWLGLMAAQLQRLPLGGTLRYVRAGLAGAFGVVGFATLILGLTLFNPVLTSESGKVLGPPLFNTLAIAFVMPALVLAATGLRLVRLNRRLRAVFLVIACGLGLFWVFAVIRHFWQGPEGMELSAGMTQPELYSYTVALLLAGSGLFYQALAKRSNTLRRAGLVAIGLAVAKVFFVDAGGLTGLTRVFSFLLLGLALAALAWLGRWAERRVAPPEP